MRVTGAATQNSRGGVGLYPGGKDTQKATEQPQTMNAAICFSEAKAGGCKPTEILGNQKIRNTKKNLVLNKKYRLCYAGHVCVLIFKTVILNCTV